MRRHALLIPLLLLAAARAPAADSGGKAPEVVFSDQEWASAQRTRPAEEASPVAAIAQLGIALAVVLGVVVGAGWALKRANLRRFMPAGRGKHLQLVETLPLAPRRSVSLVRIGEQVLVVGQAEQGLTHLATLPASVLDAAPLAAVAEPAAPAPPPPSANANAFARLYESLTGRR